MAEYFSTVEWQRGEQPFSDNEYSRGHLWQFDGGLQVPASSSPHIVPLPFSVAANVDPEEAFVAALSSCHMLFFLAIAARRKFIVDSYRDQAVGTLQKNADGRLAMTRIALRPQVVFSGARQPQIAQQETMHRQAHEQCFIANSVNTEVVVELPN